MILEMAMKSNPVTKSYKKIDLNTHGYVNYGYRYKVKDLIDESKKHEVFDLDLSSIDLSVKPWEFCERVQDLADHFLRVKDADLSFPIILDAYGYICDGWHRVMKALISNHKTVKAIRILDFPEGEKIKTNE